MNKKLAKWAAITTIGAFVVGLLALFLDWSTLFSAASVNNTNNDTKNSTIIQGPIEGGTINVQNAPASEGVPLEEAIRVEVSDYCSSGLLHPVDFVGVYEDDNFNIESNSSRGTAVCTMHGFTVDVIGKAPDEWVKLPPYLVMRITNLQPLASGRKFFAVAEPRGAGPSAPDRFEAVLAPEQTNMFAATLIPSTWGEPNTDNPWRRQSIIIRDQGYFTLQYGEREVFAVGTYAYPGYEYEFELGVVYTYKGEATIKWIDKTFSATGATEIVDFWDTTDWGNPPKHIGDDQAHIAEARQYLDEHKQKSDQALNDPSFPLPK